VHSTACLFCWFWCASRFSVSVLRSPFSFIERFRCLPDRTWDFRSDLPECRAMSVISFYFTYFNIYHLMQFWKREKQSNQHWLQRRVCDDPWFKYVHVRWASIVVRNYRRSLLGLGLSYLSISEALSHSILMEYSLPAVLLHVHPRTVSDCTWVVAARAGGRQQSGIRHYIAL